MAELFRASDVNDGRGALQRYAGAFVGSAAVADDLVAASEADEPSCESRIARYRRLHQALDAMDFPCNGASALGRLPPLERAALLLTSLEGFSYATVASILDLDQAAVRSLLQAARQRLNPADQGQVRVAILADKAGDVRAVVEAVCGLGHRICGVATDVAMLQRMVREEHPDLVVAELTFGDGPGGLTIMQDIRREISVPVVFVADHAHRLIQRDGAPALVLAKPLLPSALAAIVAIVLQRHADARPNEYLLRHAACGSSIRPPCPTSAGRETASFPMLGHPPGTFHGLRAAGS